MSVISAGNDNLSVLFSQRFCQDLDGPFRPSANVRIIEGVEDQYFHRKSTTIQRTTRFSKKSNSDDIATRHSSLFVWLRRGC